MSKHKTHFEDCDVLVVGGGMAGTGATFEARHWGRDLKIVSDFILGITILSLIFFLVFYEKKIDFKDRKKFLAVYLLVILFFLEWFFYHPTLRYGGYHIIALIFFIPLSIILGKMSNDFKMFKKKFFVLLFVTFFIFSARNIARLDNEYEKYSYNLLIDSKFKFIGGDKEFYFRYNNLIENNKKIYKVLKFFDKEIILFNK